MTQNSRKIQKMGSFKQVVAFILSLVTFVYTFYIVSKLMLFFSQPRSVSTVYAWVFNLLDNKSRLETAFAPIVYDTIYLIAFIFQHSFMKSAFVKKIFHLLGLQYAERTIYCLTSSLILHHIIKNWMEAQSFVLWHIDVNESNVLWWTFVVIHAVAWMVIYGGSVIMDLPEILGIKQTYYELKGNAPPIAYKSLELRHLYSHVRHPSFIGLVSILWITNCMTLDRLLLSTLLTAYMYFAWSTDRNDFLYQNYQLRKKSLEIKGN